MAITLIGHAEIAGAVAPAMPTGTQNGDVAIVFAYQNAGGTVSPTLPAGWTQQDASGGNNQAYITGSRVIDGTEGTPTWTGATHIALVVLRGVHYVVLGGYGGGQFTGTTTMSSYSFTVLHKPLGTSWILTFGGARATNANGLTIPGGATNLNSSVGSLNVGYVPNTTVDWPGGNYSGVTLSTSRTAAVAYEIVAAPVSSGPISGFIDDFPGTTLSSQWQVTTPAVAVANGACSLSYQAGSGNPQLDTAAAYALKGSQVWCLLGWSPSASETSYWYATFLQSTLNQGAIQFGISNGVLTVTVSGKDGSYVTLGPANNVPNPVWLRARDQSNVIYADYSSDGTTWTNVGSLDYSANSNQQWQAAVYVGALYSEAGTTGYAETLQHINVTPLWLSLKPSATAATAATLPGLAVQLRPTAQTATRALVTSPGVPGLYTGPITRLGTSTPSIGGLTAPVTQTTVTVPAAGIPVGAVIIAFGVSVNGTVTITDPRGNTWNPRPLGGSNNLGLWLQDCTVTTALISGDVITVKQSLGGPIGQIMVWYSGMDPVNCFDGVSSIGSWSGTAASAGQVTTSSAGNFIIGAFAAQNSSSTLPSLSAAGSGYTNETGASQYDSADGYSEGIDWESKLGAAIGTEQATGTWNVTPSTSGGAFTAAYGLSTKVFLGQPTPITAQGATAATCTVTAQTVPLITRGGTLPGSISTVAVTNRTATVPAGGIPVGALIVIFGSYETSPPTGASDPRGNTWSPNRSPSASSMWQFDCVVTTALQAADVITVTWGSSQSAGYATIAGGWWLPASGARLAFDAAGSHAQNGPSLTAGALTPASNGELVIGAWWLQVGNASPQPSITPGSGYTNETAITWAGPSSFLTSLVWEDKTASAAGVAENPPATSSAGNPAAYGTSSAYRSFLLAPLAPSAQAKLSATCVVAPVVGPVSQLVDSFADLSQWTVVAGSPVAGSNSLQVPADGSEVAAKNWYRLTNSQAFVLLTGPSSDPTAVSSFALVLGSGQVINWQMTSNNRLRWNAGGFAGDTVNQDGSGTWPWPAGGAAGTMWLRIRESAGTLYFDVAPDGIQWTATGSVSKTAVGILAGATDAVQVQMQAYGG